MYIPVQEVSDLRVTSHADLSDHRNKRSYFTLVLVNLRWTWCPPPRLEGTLVVLSWSSWVIVINYLKPTTEPAVNCVNAR